MTRQYKHMQTEMNAEVHRLAAELDKTKTKLGMVAYSMVSQEYVQYDRTLLKGSSHHLRQFQFYQQGNL